MTSADACFYVIGGTLRPETGSYVRRQADAHLYDGLRKGEFCHVLTSRQMGKSSLMVRTARQLREDGRRVVVLDLTAVGQNLTVEQWYDGMTANLGRQLKLEEELDAYWLGATRFSPVQRFFNAIREIAIPQSQNSLVIFLDEIDVVRSLPFSTDEFFGALRECYNRRTEDSDLNRLTICLLGVATASDLIRDTRTTPFNIGRRIELTDFSQEEAAPLAGGLGKDTTLAAELLDRILYWTNGHPYLTQRMCRAAAEVIDASPSRKSPIPCRKLIDRLCEELFLSSRARGRDDNLLFVREWLLHSGPDLGASLALYNKIRNAEDIHDDDTNPAFNTLRLSGIIRVDGKYLRVRNRIYERVFDKDWVMANIPVIRQSGETSIAVLPFMDRDEDSLKDYWTDGLTEELIHALGKVSGLRVSSWSSVIQFKGKSENLRQVAKQLDVEVILEGAVERFGQRLRVSVELVSVVDGYRLWWESFNYKAKDLAEIQNEITTAIVARLKFGWRTQPGPAIKSPTENLEAYHLYLKGRYYWNRRHEETVRQSIDLFHQAIEKDPHFALAYAGLADAYSLLGTYNYVFPADAYPKAKSAARKALELDDNLSQTHASLGCISAIYDWDWDSAESSFQRAIELNPSYAMARQWYAINCLTPLGRHEDAIKELRRAQSVDPLGLGIQASLGLALYYAREYAAAAEQCRLTLEMEERFWVSHLFLAWTYLQTGQYAEAIRAAQAACEFGAGDPVALAALGHSHALAGNRPKAHEILDELIVLANKRYVPAGEISFLCLGLGDLEQALRWLTLAEQEKALRLIYLKVEPRFDRLRSHPRFGALLATTRLNREEVRPLAGLL